MGTVYEAKALRLNATVALKETHFEDERLRKQFEREAQLLANLRHPALPRVIDHFDEPDGLYLVMDFVEGDDLWEMLKKGGEPFPAADVLKWAGQLLDALQYLHTQTPPVIHRDIKPQNLKLAEDGRLILLDFGLAKGMSDAAQSLVSSRTVMGFSLPYAPLEQILQIDESSREQLSVLNQQEVERVRHSGTNQRSDLYSVGATLLHLLTGRVPVTSPTRAIAVWSDRADPLEAALVQGVPESLRAFIRRSMTLDPEQRFGSAAEMRDALRDATEGITSGAVLTPTVLDSPSGLKTQPSKDSRPDDSTLTTPRVLPVRSLPPTRDSRRRARQRGLLTAGVMLLAVSIAAAWVFFSRPSVLAPAPNPNTNSAAQQTPTPAPQPSVSPTPEVGVSPTPEASQQPVDNPTNANRRAVPVTTPTPRPVATPPQPQPTPQPQPQPTPTPQVRPNNPPELGGDAGRDVSRLDNEIAHLEQRRAQLLRRYPPEAPIVRRLDDRIDALKRRRARRLQDR
jgi:serine/threonine protein kinase